ncbi:MAG: hypothetical protein PWQ56_310 [Patescibacteria group bacterium]|nr:hypothetical protein [Patescibacteria group bacterium]
MAKEKLNDYIKKCVELGKEKEEIENNLLSVGWSKEDIDEAFSLVVGEDVPVPDVSEEEDLNSLSPEEPVDEFSNSLNNEINSIQGENNLNNQQPKGDPFLEPIEEQSEEPQNNKKSTQEQNQEPVIIEEPSGGKFVDSSKKVDAKKILIPIVAILVTVFLFATVFAFVQKSGPFSFLKEEPEIISEEEDIVPPQEEPIVEEPIIEWACGDQLVDERDGNTYPTIQVGSQCFMAKNLNYKTENSFCYGDVENCEEHGLLYDWSTAVSACPLGWSLPSDAEFKMLERYLGMEEEKIDTTGWREVSPNAQGTLELLNITLSGAKDVSGEFKYQGEYANLWTSDLIDEEYLTRAFRAKDNNVYRGSVSGEYGYSVRCVRY